ncbi:IclR family transcriptional regulator [Flavobacterium restrictum]|uniref:Helix-turn-helix domain-containing protein n=1 Tax=Flavobacterium restrictum TaxID=2594428 RepID=A0A553EDI2_9FLAO|nr:helix-turn-helix domain-containing protein [Flavobacterium restrictum]TRX43114.1 helix-turn-helix domain-containing protein [Flavobacterium restrictum]
MKEKEENGAYSAPALDKGLDILEVLCKSENGLTQQEISGQLGRKLGEIYRMLNCLVQRNYVANYGNVYTITSKLFQLSHFHPPTYRLLTEALPLMEELSRAVSFPCDLRVYNNGFQTVVASIQPPNGLGFMTRVGSEIEVAPSASGLVLLAFQDPVITDIRIRECLLNTSESEIETFRKGLIEVASNGFASIKSKQYAGLHAISFPILDMNGNAVAAMTVPMLARIDGTNQLTHQEVAEKLKYCVSNLNQKIAKL